MPCGGLQMPHGCEILNERKKRDERKAKDKCPTQRTKKGKWTQMANEGARPEAGRQGVTKADAAG